MVMEIAQYHYLRECEGDTVLAQTRDDVASGRSVSQGEAPKATFSHIIETYNASYRHAQA